MGSSQHGCLHLLGQWKGDGVLDTITWSWEGHALSLVIFYWLGLQGSTYTQGGGDYTRGRLTEGHLRVYLPDMEIEIDR